MKRFSPTRRQTVLSSLAATALVLQPKLGFAAAPRATKQTPAYYVTSVGDYQLTTLLDRTMQMPADQRLIGAAPTQLRAWLATRFRSATPSVSVNTFLLNTGPELFLVDAGGGELMGAGGAALLPTLQAAGYQTGQIDKVLLSHMHIDHIGGLSHDGKAVFENAQLWVPQAELDYWLNTEQRAQAPEQARASFDLARNAIEPYRAAGRLQVFQWGDELAPGVRAVDLHGHTPGHTGFDIERNGEHLRIWADIVHVQDVQFDHPEISIEFDSDPEAAKTQRLRALQDASQRGYRVAGSHMAFPGIGHVRRKGDAFEWIADAFTTQIK